MATARACSGRIVCRRRARPCSFERLLGVRKRTDLSLEELERRRALLVALARSQSERLPRQRASLRAHTARLSLRRHREGQPRALARVARCLSDHLPTFRARVCRCMEAPGGASDCSDMRQAFAFAPSGSLRRRSRGCLFGCSGLTVLRPFWRGLTAKARCPCQTGTRLGVVRVSTGGSPCASPLHDRSGKNSSL